MLFHSNNGCISEPHCNVDTHIACLFVSEVECVYCEVRTEIQVNKFFKYFKIFSPFFAVCNSDYPVQND